MSKKLNGFSAVEALLILVIIAILGFTGWYVWQSKQSTDKIYNNNANTASSVSSTSANKQVGPYANWKTFCSSMTNACFKYNSSWTFAECAPTQINVAGNFQNCPSAESASVISPDKIRIDWNVDPYDPNATNSCTNGTYSFPGVTYSDITKVTNTSNIYFVNVKESQDSYSYIGHLALTTGSNEQQPSVDQKGALCPTDPIFLSKDSKYQINFVSSYNVNTHPNLPASDQEAAPSQTDLNSIKQTLLSFYYK